MNLSNLFSIIKDIFACTCITYSSTVITLHLMPFVNRVCMQDSKWNELATTTNHKSSIISTDKQSCTYIISCKADLIYIKSQKASIEKILNCKVDFHIGRIPLVRVLTISKVMNEGE